VTLTIDLDNKLAGMRDQICDVVAHWRLAAEAEAGKAMRFKVTPKKSLGASHRAPELLGASSLKL
jgi:hypothetical protein